MFHRDKAAGSQVVIRNLPYMYSMLVDCVRTTVLIEQVETGPDLVFLEDTVLKSLTRQGITKHLSSLRES